MGNTARTKSVKTKKHLCIQRRIRPKVFTELIPTKFSKELVKVIDYIVSNYHFQGKKVYNGRSNFIRSACINTLRLKLSEMGEDEKLRKF